MAHRVGARHGFPVILCIDARRMRGSGHVLPLRQWRVTDRSGGTATCVLDGSGLAD
jgi:hypothetical protein